MYAELQSLKKLKDSLEVQVREKSEAVEATEKRLRQEVEKTCSLEREKAQLQAQIDELNVKVNILVY